MEEEASCDVGASFTDASSRQAWEESTSPATRQHHDGPDPRGSTGWYFIHPVPFLSSCDMLAFKSLNVKFTVGRTYTDVHRAK